MALTEGVVRDYLAKHIETFRDLIVGYDDILAQLSGEIEKFDTTLPVDCEGPRVNELMIQIARRKQRDCLVALESLELIDVEFELLKTGKRGKLPSADILVRIPMSGSFGIIEVKISHQTERQAVTELSAYTHGLNDRFFAISSLNTFWVPVCTDWRSTPYAAFAYQQFFNGITCIPLKAVIQTSGNSVDKISLDYVELTPYMSFEQSAALFSWYSFDAFVFSLMEIPISTDVIQEMICSSLSQMKLSGFCLTSMQNSNIYHYQANFIVGIYNPIKGALKKRQLEIVKRDSPSMLVVSVKKPLWDFLDIDFVDGEDVFLDYSEDGVEIWPQIQISTMEMTTESRGNSFAIQKIKDILSHHDGHFTLECPNLYSLLYHESFLKTHQVKSAGYFGLFQDVIMERCKFDSRHNLLEGDFFSSYRSFAYFRDFMSRMNFEGESDPSE